MTNKDRDGNKCLALSFRPLIEHTGFGSDEQESIFRFSKVVLTATFDPSCWTEGACVDRQTVLKDAEVVSVRERQPGVSGIWLQGRSILTEISDRRAIELKSAAIRAGFPERQPIKAFQSEGADQRIIVCWSNAVLSKEPGAWPTSLESALYAKATLDFFHCSEVKQIDGQMILQV
jgi:hypothetical protein